ncbi:MAG TPA: alpha-D-ribose 1-methylphosphonate 5-triphosphate diphosphatase [Pseudonocardiaceae bacterium]
MSRLILTHATAVLPDRVANDAVVVAEGGLITEIGTAGTGAPAEAIDLRGALLLPGLVDAHSDGLERDLRPRPGAEMDPYFAVTAYEGRARGAGVTTVFHGIGYYENTAKERSVEQAEMLVGVLGERAGGGAALVDHRVLLRLDARAEYALEALKGAVDRLHRPGRPLPLVSFEDHTPGQGQYADVAAFKRAIEVPMPADQLDAHVREHIEHRATIAWHRDVSIAWLSEQAIAGRIRLMAHDPVTADEIHLRAEQGVTVAEFPTTHQAARAAREAGLLTVAGAPNVLRGGSHAGNVSATELIREGLVDALSSDYMPAALLAAAITLAGRGIVALPRAVALITRGGALVGGLDDRGELRVGGRADLTVATVDGGWPTVRRVLLAEELRDDHPAGPLERVR